MSLVSVFPEFSTDPWRSLENRLLRPWSRQEYTKEVFQPAMDLSETKESYHITADVPGFKKDEIKVNATGSTLTIKGSHTEEKREENLNYHYQERSTADFQRSIRLPMNVEESKIKASIKDGILKVMVPKVDTKAKLIEISEE